MSAELWQQAKEALAEVMELAHEKRENFLWELQEKSPEVHAEVMSLLAAQETAEQQGFLEETYDQYQTLEFDPERTNEQPSTVDYTPPKPSNNLVGEDYELEKKIGQGGMGVVYKAYHRSLRRTVALKIITGGGLRDEVDIARFHIEAEAAARLDHPGIIPVYDVGEHNGNHYYAMAYVEGPSLAEYVGSKTEPLDPRRSAELIEQVCRAVQYAHDRAVIHRDLKPANIMLENGEVPRLADFGLAKDMHSDDGLTMTGQVMGTPSYMAPEQATGKLDQISNRTDVYSLGATLYALLAGKPPFAGATLLETIRKVVRTAPESLKEAEHGVPRDLQIISEKCLAKKPEDRYASAADVADDLRRYLDGYAISARPLGPVARSWRWCQRNPLVASLLGGIAATLLVGIIVSTRFGIEANRALAEAKQNAKNLRSAMQRTFVFASEDVLAQEPGMQKARAVLLEEAQKYYAELVEQTPHDIESQRELADAQFMLSKIQMAMGKDAEARETLHKGLKLQQTLAAKMPKDADLLTALAKTHNQLAKWAEKSWQSMMQMYDAKNLSAELVAQAEQLIVEWKRHSAEVIRLRGEVVELQPKDWESHRLFANAHMNEGNAISIRGYTQRKITEQDKARVQHIRAQDIRLDALEKSPEEVLIRRDLGRGYYNLAHIELRATELERTNDSYRQRLHQSVKDLTKAIEAYEGLPATELALDNHWELAQCYRLRADSYFWLVDDNPELDESAKALADNRHAESILTTLTTRNPNVTRYRRVLAETQFNSCNFLFAMVEDDRAAVQLAKCRETLLQALRIDPKNEDAVDQIVRFTQAIVDSLTLPEKQDFDMADRLIQEAAGELLALQQESAEYSELGSWIEKLRAAASKVKKQREAAENPDDVA